MNGADFLPWISISVTLLLGVLVFITNRRANRTSEKKLTVEEQQAEDVREDMIAKRSASELERLYKRTDDLETTVAELQRTVTDLQEADRRKQKTINDQADELERTKDELHRTNQVLTDVRALVSNFASRVQEAWTNGHTMPTLTVDELSLLNDTIPKSTYLKNRGAT